MPGAAVHDKGPSFPFHNIADFFSINQFLIQIIGTGKINFMIDFSRIHSIDHFKWLKKLGENLSFKPHGINMA